MQIKKIVNSVEVGDKIEFYGDILGGYVSVSGKHVDHYTFTVTGRRYKEVSIGGRVERIIVLDVDDGNRNRTLEFSQQYQVYVDAGRDEPQFGSVQYI